MTTTSNFSGAAMRSSVYRIGRLIVGLSTPFASTTPRRLGATPSPMERVTTEQHLALGRSVPDYLATLKTSELQTIFRETTTMPLEQLLNRGAFRVDVGQKRIWRDSFWKGTFARDRLLG